MILRQLVLERFMSHDSTVLDIPERGLIAVVGANGSGKSSLVECVPHVLWGKSLRGHLGWRRRKYGSKVTIVLGDGTKISRKRENDASHVEIVTGGSDRSGDLYDTARKAQGRIDHDYGSMDVWQRTSVFSSSDAANFSTATDGERKRLLEVLLGLSRFDPALQRCRDQLKTMRDEVACLQADVDRRQTEMESERKRLGDVRSDLAALVAPEAPVMEAKPQLAVTHYEVTPAFTGDAAALLEKSTSLASTKDSLDDTIAELTARIGSIQEAMATQRERMRVARVELDSLGSGDSCSRCGQDVTKLRDALVIRIKESEALAQTEIERLTKELRGLRDDLTIERETLNDIVGSINKISTEIASARRQNEEHERSKQRAANAVDAATKDHAAAMKLWEGRCARAQTEHTQRMATFDQAQYRLREREREIMARMIDLDDELDSATFDLDRARRDAAELEACEEALGLRGIRAHVLGRALGGIESVANYWLTHVVGPGLKLKLAAYSENKTGGISDAISLTIEGAGAGEYLGASGGERRRFDVAILLALAEVARAAVGSGAGTIFFDEVFDALDREGQHAVADALRELAAERAVFVISHSEDLVSALRPDMLVRVHEGKICVAA